MTSRRIAWSRQRRAVSGFGRWALFLLGAVACLGRVGALAWAQSPPSENRSSKVDIWAPLRASPPAASAPRRDGPSDVVYPPQRVPLHFSHRRHLARGAVCETCHPVALTSTSSRDNLLPREEQCRACHAIDRSRPFGALFSASPPGTPPVACAACHIGFPSEPAENGQPTLAPGSDFMARIARVDLAPPNLKFNHRLHAGQGIGCAVCHGDLSLVDQAGRAQLPSMGQCLRCHDGGLRRAKTTQSGAGQGTSEIQRPAGSPLDRCSVCHPTVSSGLLQVQFASGVLVPRGSLRGDDHRGAGSRRSHGTIAQSGPD